MSTFYRSGLRLCITRSAALRTTYWHKSLRASATSGARQELPLSFLEALSEQPSSEPKVTSALKYFLDYNFLDYMTEAQKELVAKVPLPDEVPTLPEIQSDHLRTKVFTHRSFFARPTHQFEDRLDDLSPDNERLEHLGDSVVGILTTEMILERFPGIRCGPATKIKSLCVGNPTLAAIAARYHLPDRLRVHHAQALILRASQNIQGAHTSLLCNNFTNRCLQRIRLKSAYCGALFLEAGLDGIRHWFRQLVMPWVEESYKIMKIEHGVNDDELDPRLISNPPNLTASQRLPPSIMQPTGIYRSSIRPSISSASMWNGVLKMLASRREHPCGMSKLLFKANASAKARAGQRRLLRMKLREEGSFISRCTRCPEPSQSISSLDDVIENMTSRNDHHIELQ
ncbi:ribonuclease III domain-containing protein [Auriculariales sp. MPI-PUGE-AT-0066]|nr:ribonuclease III domain-containing protein [Auriculariales sp. MPI-PUGE-AT-0066]